MAKVECANDKNLCNDIQAFPTVWIYHEGKQVLEYGGMNDYEPTLKYFREMLVKYPSKAANQTDESKLSETEKGFRMLEKFLMKEKEPREDINPQGQVVHLTDTTFDKLTHGTTWFVMFHAPWCGQYVTLMD